MLTLIMYYTGGWLLYIWNLFSEKKLTKIYGRQTCWGMVINLFNMDTKLIRSTAVSAQFKGGVCTVKILETLVYWDYKWTVHNMCLGSKIILIETILQEWHMFRNKILM